MTVHSLIPAVAAAAALGCRRLRPGPAVVTLEVHTPSARASACAEDFIKPWTKKVEKDSGGRIKFEVYPSMQLGGTPAQLYDQARTASSTSSGRCRATRRAASRKSKCSSCRSSPATPSRTARRLGILREAPQGRVQGRADHRGAHARPGPVPRQGQRRAQARGPQGPEGARRRRGRSTSCSALGATPVGMPVPQCRNRCPRA